MRLGNMGNFASRSQAEIRRGQSIPGSPERNCRPPLILAAHEICFLVDANKSASLMERVFSGDESLPSTVVDRGAKRVTWILGKA
jgi:6-phosphogluconolactonase/glucosamine-6-phosphate isomerase/deaminase